MNLYFISGFACGAAVALLFAFPWTMHCLVQERRDANRLYLDLIDMLGMDCCDEDDTETDDELGLGLQDWRNN